MKSITPISRRNRSIPYKKYEEYLQVQQQEFEYYHCHLTFNCVECAIEKNKELAMNLESCKSKSRCEDWKKLVLGPLKAFIWTYFFENRLKERKICSRVTGKNRWLLTHSIDDGSFAPIVCSRCLNDIGWFSC